MLGVFKCVPEATVPSYATKFSACFDLHSCIPSGTEVKAIIPTEVSYRGSSTEDTCTLVSDESGCLIIPARARVLIPTGLKFNIPPCCSVRLHPRSGLSFKHGLILANCEGVIDEDYVDQVFIILHNISNVNVTIKHGDRVCQAELIRDSRDPVLEIFNEPQKKTDRSGGLGSTGV